MAIKTKEKQNGRRQCFECCVFFSAVFVCDDKNELFFSANKAYHANMVIEKCRKALTKDETKTWVYHARAENAKAEKSRERHKHFMYIYIINVVTFTAKILNGIF